MADVFSKADRSRVMASIRGRGNRDTELALLKVFRRERISGWRRQSAILGKPDFVFPKARIAVFVDGCFWHGCPRHFQQPKNNARFWKEKISTNMRRDKFVGRALRARGWLVIRFWEHDLTQSRRHRITERISATLLERSRSRPQNPEHPTPGSTVNERTLAMVWQARRAN
jgi:DNA mismatch endonuclease, patch repair protein